MEPGTGGGVEGGPRVLLRLEGVAVLLACSIAYGRADLPWGWFFGLFLAPMTATHGWTASAFALAIAVQVLLNGASQPVCGNLADRLFRGPGLFDGAVVDFIDFSFFPAFNVADSAITVGAILLFGLSLFRK